MEMKRVVYPGSFDPITLGHVDIIRRAASFFDEIIVAVHVNSDKHPTFDLKERVDMIDMCIDEIDNVSVQGFEGLLADFTRKSGATAVIKGLRAVSDYEYELQMANMNKKLFPEMETLFMMASAEYSFLSSSLVKDVARFGGDISDLIPARIVKKVEEKMRGEK